MPAETVSPSPTRLKPPGDSIILEEEIDPNYVPSDDEINEYATWLGMDVAQDASLLWIAREGLKAPLPENWKPCKTTDTDEIYYFNFSSGDSTWDHPCDDYYRTLYESERKKRAEESKEQADTSKQREKDDVRKLLDKKPAKKKAKAPLKLGKAPLGALKAEKTGGLAPIGGPARSRSPAAKKAPRRVGGNEVARATAAATDDRPSSQNGSQSGDRPASRTRNRLAAAVSASDSDASATIHAAETKIEGLLSDRPPAQSGSSDRPPSQNGSNNGDRPRSRNRALAAVQDAQASNAAAPAPGPAASPELVRSLKVERDALKQRALTAEDEAKDALRRASSDDAEVLGRRKDAEDRLKAAEDAAEARCRAAEDRAAKAEAACEDRVAKADARVATLEADLARDSEAARKVDTRLEERTLELQAAQRKTEALQDALEAAQRYEAPGGDDEEVERQMRAAVDRAASLEREVATIKADAAEIATHAAEQTRRREAAETAMNDASQKLEAAARDAAKAQELCGAKATALEAQATLAATLQAELKTARAARDAAERALHESDTARSSQAQAEVADVRAELQRSRARMENAERDAALQRERGSSGDVAEKRAREAEARLELLERDRRDECKGLEDAKARSDDRLRSLEERTERASRAADDARDDARKGRATIDDLRRQLDDRSDSTPALQAARDRAQAAEERAAREGGEVSKLKRQLTEGLKAQDDAETRCAASETEVRKLKAEVREAARKLNDAEDRATEAEKEKAWQVEKLGTVSQRADGEAAKRVSAERDLASLRASVDGGTGDAVLVESLRLRAEAAEGERDDAVKRALHVETELARLRTQAPATQAPATQAPATPTNNDNQATGAPTDAASRLGDERSALAEAKELVQKQRDWLKQRQRQLEGKRRSWRSRSALKESRGSTRERQDLDREAADLNKLVRQLRNMQRWLSDRDAKVSRVETGASPLAELDLLDDDTFCSTVSATPKRRGRRHRRAPEQHYGCYDPYRPPQAYYVPYYTPPPPPRPTDAYYQYAQQAAPSNSIPWAPPPPQPAPQPTPQPTPQPAPQPAMATPLRDWAATREKAQTNLTSHVKWLDGLRAELTAHCYGPPAPEVVGVAADAALDAAVEARLRG